MKILPFWRNSSSSIIPGTITITLTPLPTTKATTTSMPTVMVRIRLREIIVVSDTRRKSKDGEVTPETQTTARILLLPTTMVPKAVETTTITPRSQQMSTSVI
jgi:hypothetical protein